MSIKLEEQGAITAFRRLLRADRALFDMTETLRAAGWGEWTCGIEIERVRLANQLEQLQTAAYRGLGRVLTVGRKRPTDSK